MLKNPVQFKVMHDIYLKKRTKKEMKRKETKRTKLAPLIVRCGLKIARAHRTTKPPLLFYPFEHNGSDMPNNAHTQKSINIFKF